MDIYSILILENKHILPQGKCDTEVGAPSSPPTVVIPQLYLAWFPPPLSCLPSTELRKQQSNQQMVLVYLFWIKICFLVAFTSNPQPQLQPPLLYQYEDTYQTVLIQIKSLCLAYPIALPGMKHKITKDGVCYTCLGHSKWKKYVKSYCIFVCSRLGGSSFQGATTPGLAFF